MHRSVARVALLMAVALLAGCAALKYQTAEAPRVSLSSLELTSLNLVEQSFDVGLRLRNPNDFALPIEGVEYTLFLDGEQFASGMTNDPVRLEALGEQVVRVGVTTNLLNNLKQVQRWRSGPPEALDYRVEGRVSVQGVPLRLPFDYTGSVPLTTGF